MASADNDCFSAAHWPGIPDYNGVEVLSPMVRASTLPLRLTCLRYGADLVYSGVLIDRCILETVRVENDAFGVVDYVSPREKRAIWSTCSEERNRVIFQIGTADSALAVQAALHVCRDVRGVDVNMGCMAPFSATGGMGAALLDKPDAAADIIRTLRRELPSSLPVTCKIRMLPTMKQTLDFVQLLERSGANAVAVHLRTQEEGQAGNTLQYKKAAHWSMAQQISSAVSIPVIANGDFLSRQRIQDFWSTHVSGDADVDGSSSQVSRPAGVMVARGALWNPSIFDRAAAHVDAEERDGTEVIRRFLRAAVATNSSYENTKWVVTEMLKGATSLPGLAQRQRRLLKFQLQECKSIAAMCAVFSEAHDPEAYPPEAHTLDYYRAFQGHQPCSPHLCAASADVVGLPPSDLAPVAISVS
eukprot:TRINITY_DN37730_c0_g1_i1.p1 TRINITY_DN37730_c0_g1~~TRINITY_DN37730_c0_g1_i1.p1  ORF type:complete len:429 (+),score=68.16 TRINITY_DN37730_c0_g1_i1:40-1287(+)